MPRPLLTEAAAVLLISLADGTRDVHGLAEELNQLPGQHAPANISAIYGFLERLHHQGLVEVAEEEHVNGRVRRRFRLTEAGYTAIRTESARWRRLADEAEQRLVRRSTFT